MAGQLGIASLTGAALVIATYLLRKLLRRNKPIREGTIALITGGGSGIGLEIALTLSKKGCQVLLVGRTLQTLQDARIKCLAAGSPCVTPIVCDITKKEDIIRLAELPSTKHIDILVLNAGRGAISKFDPSPESYNICEEMMKLNFFSNVMLIQALMERIEESKGKYLVISSLAGVLPSAHRAAYTASKHAMQGFCNAFRQELIAATMTVCCPGFVQTDFHERVMKSESSNSHSTRKNAMSAAQCAAICVDSLERGAFETIMSTDGIIGYMLRPVFPSLVDYFAKRKALRSIGK
eukprot:Tbor_TRINITY_DN4628_c0_g1::TRINITY_DN4628_c0_g1_i1::g.14811::m.14811